VPPRLATESRNCRSAANSPVVHSPRPPRRTPQHGTVALVAVSVRTSSSTVCPVSEQLPAEAEPLTAAAIPAGDASESRKEVVPEADPDLAEDEPSESDVGADESEELRALVAVLSAGGVPAEFRQEPQLGRGSRAIVEVPAGSSTRRLVVDSAGAQVLIDNNVGQWISLERYDGLCNPTQGKIEVIVSSDRFGFSAARFLRRMTRDRSSERVREVPEIQVVGPERVITLTLGPPSRLASVVLGSPRLQPADASRYMVTLVIEGIHFSSSTDAEVVLERIADAYFFELDLRFGTNFRLARLESRPRRPPVIVGESRDPDVGLSFPRNAYPHEPIVLYRAARDRAVSPLIRYWGYYQVLEFFFPKYTLEEAKRRLAAMIRDPRFNIHSDDDLTRAVQTMISSGRGVSGREEEQLVSAIQSIVSDNELADFIKRAGIDAALSDRRNQISSNLVSLKAPGALTTAVARRVYDVRCRIVHSKSENDRERAPGLLPGSHHDDLVLAEIPLVEFLAQRALLAAAEQLIVPARGPSSAGSA
jgi:hypothetical protein